MKAKIGGNVTVVAETPHFSEFVLAGKQSNISVVSQDIPTTVSVDDTLSLDVGVENTGRIAGAAVIELLVDGTLLTENVTLEPGEETTVTLTYPVTDTGELTVELPDGQQTTVTVEESADGESGEQSDDEPVDSDDKQDSTDEPPSDEDDTVDSVETDDSVAADDDGSLGFAVVLVALAALGALQTRRHRTP